MATTNCPLLRSELDIKSCNYMTRTSAYQKIVIVSLYERSGHAKIGYLISGKKSFFKTKV